ncbi:MAG: toprim domain-containing protein [Planctomycetota bacterium]|nr:toprim domain-containing protein [Planctomycetota bacterium]
MAADESAALCQRVESPKRVGDAGWLHRLREVALPPGPVRRVLRVAPEPAETPVRDWAEVADRYAAAVDPDRLVQLADDLGLTVGSLRRLRIGWADDHGAWAFPMAGPASEVRGVRLRFPSGAKLSIKGGKEGLFIPVGLDAPGEAARGGRLLVTEGPTDCAALLDLGFDAVGRPSCTGGTLALAELVRLREATEVVIVADADAPGRRGAESLAVVLVTIAPAVRIITPPDPVKDARAWKRAGATHQDVLQRIEAAPVRRLTLVTIASRRKGGR